MKTRAALHAADEYKKLKRADGQRWPGGLPIGRRSRRDGTVKCAWLHMGHDLQLDNDTPALNALKALRGAPTSMGRGETPVELFADSRSSADFSIWATQGMT